MNFWKEVRNVNRNVSNISQCIDGVSTPSEIISTFETKFIGELNDTGPHTANTNTVSLGRASDSKFVFTLDYFAEVVKKNQQ